MKSVISLPMFVVGIFMEANRYFRLDVLVIPTCVSDLQLLFRLLVTCEKHDVYIRGCYEGVSTPLSGAGLSLFFQESRSCLRQVTLSFMTLSADQFLALATMSRLDVQLKILECGLADDAAGAFVECLHSDRGPVELNDCDIHSQTMAHALTGSSSVTRFKPYNERITDAGMDLLVAALANNRGLVNLNLFNKTINLMPVSPGPSYFDQPGPPLYQAKVPYW
jgi:hypothetical protein